MEKQSTEPRTLNYLPVERYGWMDFSVGMLMGFYYPISSRARNNDCRSAWLGLILNFMPYTKYFDQPLEGFKPTMVTQVLQSAVKINSMIGTCTDQLDTADSWTTNFGLDENFAIVERYAASLDTPYVGASVDDSSFDVADGILVV